MYFRRLKTFLGLIVVVLIVWIARLSLLQLVRGDDYLQQARESLINPPKRLPTERGRIVDRHTVLLALDEPSFGVAVEYGVLTGNPYYLASGQYRPRISRSRAEALAGPARERYEELIDQVGQLCGLSRQELDARRQRIIREVQVVKDGVSRRVGRSTFIPAEFMAHTLVEDLSPDAQARVRALLGDTPGVTVAATMRRYYPMGECVAHLVGSEGPVDKDDLERDPFAAEDGRRYLPGDRRGLTGIEWLAEMQLRGSRGLRQTDREGAAIQDVPAVRGGNVQLTIDAILQKQVYDALARHVVGSPYPCGGAAVVINLSDRSLGGHVVRGGEVLALASYPSFDPNHWREFYRQLSADERGQPMLFRAVAAAYPPGSIVKPVTLAAALAEGKVRADETINCPGWLLGPDKPFKCWSWSGPNKFGHGELAASEALKFSCNVFFYTLGERLTLPVLSRWMERFGLGVDLGTGLAEERRGVVPNPAWLAAHRGGLGGASAADARNVGIGQGDLAITPLAAANTMATIARGGIAGRPLLVCDGKPTPVMTRVGVDPAWMDIIRDGMVRVVNEPHGTAHAYAFMTEVKLAGKTGSAQASRRWIGGQFVAGRRVGGQLFPPATHRVIRTIDGERVEVEEPLRPSHAWFAGFAPADKPTIAFACVIEYGMSGGRAAGPLAKDIIRLCIDRGYIEAAPASPPAGATGPGESSGEAHP